MADTPGVIGGKRAGVPSPEGNPKIKQCYGRGPGRLPQKQLGADGNAVLVPVATWGAIRLYIKISQGGVLNLVFADSLGEPLGPKVAASGVLTVTVNPLNTNTVTLNTGEVYTFQTTLTNVDKNVLIGLTLAESLANLVAAITLGDGAGTLYAAATTLNTVATAVLTSGTEITATAKSGGASGNALVTTETLPAGAWSPVGTLGGGVDGDITVDETAIVADTGLMVDIPGVAAAAPEHVGEPYLLVSVAGLAADADVTIFDAMGASW